ncbi:glycoside hydrolase family 92 protein [Apiospora rasikravindrae]|uniref:Glycoside hydrolase family 92 protein n=1 Tax=Apiospora rasikravindrae TaxID=990691 RepID=A0ABR1SMB2_9PEZI
MPPKKRENACSTPQAAATSRRRSARVSSTGKKSNYFEDDVDESDGNVATRKPAKNTKKRARSELDQDEDDGSDEAPYKEESVSPSRENGEEEDQGEGDDPKASKKAKEGNESDAGPPRKRGRPSKAATAEATPKGQSKAAAAGDDENSDEDEEFDEENRVTFEPLPQLRDKGGIEYEDTRIHPNTLAFLKDLKANNKRSWLKARDPEFRRSLKDWDSFVETLTEKITEADETIPELPLKDVVFRIYRDIRFSKDPTPYKVTSSSLLALHLTTPPHGRGPVAKVPMPATMCTANPAAIASLAAGCGIPTREAIAKLRASIDERPHRIRRVLANPHFRRTFLPKAKDGDDKSIIAAFTAANKENALKTRPQGFHPDHRDIELLKLRNFTVGTKLKDSDFTSSAAQDKIMAIIEPMVEYVTFLNRVVMPDPGDDSDSDTDENHAGGDDE